MSLLNSAICRDIQNNNSYFSTLPQGCFRSVVVITCASHAQGPRFDPGRKQVFFSFFSLRFFFLTWKDTDANSETTTCISSSIPLSSPKILIKWFIYNIIMQAHFITIGWAYQLNWEGSQTVPENLSFLFDARTLHFQSACSTSYKMLLPESSAVGYKTEEVVIML